MGKQTISGSKCVIYPMYVFNLACTDTCKLDDMPVPFRPAIFNSFNFFLESLKVVLINMVWNFDDASKIGYSRPS